VLGVILFLVNWFVSDMELLGCFGAPVVMVGGMEVTELGVRGGRFILTTLLVVVRFSSLSTGVHQLYLRSCFLDSDGPGNFDLSPEVSV
jgi:hypothetical protein